MTSENEDPSKSAPEASGGSVTGPLIFISHDTRDTELAEAFSRLCAGVSTGLLKCFWSSDRKGSQGLEYGQDWYPGIMDKLSQASDVVCLLTKRSLDRPWILYEVGVAKGKLNTPVLGIALGIPLTRANTGPFAQFQNSTDDIPALTKVVMQLLLRVPGSNPSPDVIQMLVEKFKSEADKILEHLAEEDDGSDDTAGGEASVAKLFEEVKVMFEDMPPRIERRLSDVGYRGKRFGRRLHPRMMMDMMHMTAREAGDPIAILMMASVLRDDLPWLYELAVEAYHAARAGDVERCRDLLQSFRRTAELTLRGPMSDEFGPFGRDLFVIANDLPDMIEHTVLSALRPPRPRAKKSAPKAPTEHTK